MARQLAATRNTRAWFWQMADGDIFQWHDCFNEGRHKNHLSRCDPTAKRTMSLGRDRKRGRWLQLIQQSRYRAAKRLGAVGRALSSQDNGQRRIYRWRVPDGLRCAWCAWRASRTVYLAGRLTMELITQSVACLTSDTAPGPKKSKPLASCDYAGLGS